MGFVRVRRVLLAIGGVLVLPLALAAALLGFVHTTAGEAWLAGRIAAFGGGEVEGLEIAWPLQPRLRRLTVADARGPWLEVRGMALEWSPRRLLGGTFAAQRLAAEHVDIMRQPVAADDGGGGLPRLPLGVDVREFAADLTYQNSIAMALRGRAQATEGRINLDADLRRTDVPGTGTAVVDYDRDAGRLKVDVAVDERLGAALAMFDLPPLALRLAGDGPLADWRGRLVATHVGATCAEADLRLAGRPETELAAAGRIGAECLPSGLRPMLAAAPVVFDGAAVFGRDRFAVSRLDVRSGELAASVSGSLGEQHAWRFELDAGRLDRVLGAGTSGSAHLSGTVVGTRAAPVVELALSSPRGDVHGRGWQDLGARLLLRAEREEWVASGKAELTASGIAAAVDGPLKLALDARLDQRRSLVRIPAVRLDSRLGILTLRGTAREAGRALALNGLLRSARLDALVPEGAGNATLAVTVRGDAVEPDLRIGFTGSTVGLRTGIAQVDALLGPRAAVKGAAAITPRGVPVVNATVTGAASSLRLGGAVTPVLGLGWHLRLPDLAAVEGAELTGAAEARGFALGDIARPSVGALASSDAITHAAAGTWAVKAAAGLDDVGAAPAGLFRAGIAGHGRQAELASAFRLGEGFAVSDIVVTSGRDRLTGDVALPPGQGPAGTLKAEIADLAAWKDLAGIDLGGRLGATATLAGDKMEATLRGSDLRIGGAAFSRANVNLAGDPQAVEFRMDGQGELGVDATGGWRRDEAGQSLRLAALQLRRAGQSARLVEPTTLTQTADGWRLARTTFDLARGRVSLAGSTAGEDLDLQAEIRLLPLELVDVFLPEQGMTGTVNGQLRLAGSMAAPQAEAELQGRGIGFAAGRERVDMDATARWRDRVLRVDARATGTGGATARVDASLPLVLDGGLHIPAQGPLRGQLQADGQVERITEALPLAGHRLAGRLHADMRLGGTMAEPRVDGAATLEDGYYEFYKTGTVIRGVRARMVAEDSRSYRLTLEGNDGRAGRVAADGVLRLVEAGAAYQAGVGLTQFRVVDIDGGTAQASGELALQGLGSRGALTGRIDIGPAEFNIAGHLPGGRVPHIDVVEINKPGEPRRRSAQVRAPSGGDADRDQAGAEAPVVIALDIDTRVQRLFVRGRGLDSVWAGRLTIGGTATDPSVVGSLEAERGSYDFVGHTFRLRDSRVVFEGGMMPRLDVLAESQARDLTAQVRVTGAAVKPELDFTSEPAYPKDEILARLLFGKQVGQLTVGQQVQLARAAAALGGGGGFDPIGGLRQALGLDVLDVGTAEGEDDEGGLSPRVTVGKYLDENTFLKVEEGGGKSGAVSIERQIGRGLSVEGGVGRRGGGSVGLNWRRDY